MPRRSRFGVRQPSFHGQLRRAARNTSAARRWRTRGLPSVVSRQCTHRIPSTHVSARRRARVGAAGPVTSKRTCARSDTGESTSEIGHVKLPSSSPDPWCGCPLRGADESRFSLVPPCTGSWPTASNGIVVVDGAWDALSRPESGAAARPRKRRHASARHTSGGQRARHGQPRMARRRAANRGIRGQARATRCARCPGPG